MPAWPFLTYSGALSSPLRPVLLLQVSQDLGGFSGHGPGGAEPCGWQHICEGTCPWSTAVSAPQPHTPHTLLTGSAVGKAPNQEAASSVCGRGPSVLHSLGWALAQGTASVAPRGRTGSTLPGAQGEALHRALRWAGGHCPSPWAPGACESSLGPPATDSNSQGRMTAWEGTLVVPDPATDWAASAEDTQWTSTERPSFLLLQTPVESGTETLTPPRLCRPRWGPAETPCGLAGQACRTGPLWGSTCVAHGLWLPAYGRLRPSGEPAASSWPQRGVPSTAGML